MSPSHYYLVEMNLSEQSGQMTSILYATLTTTYQNI